MALQKMLTIAFQRAFPPISATFQMEYITPFTIQIMQYHRYLRFGGFIIL